MYDRDPEHEGPRTIQSLLPAKFGETYERRCKRSQEEAERKLAVIVEAAAKGKLRTPGEIKAIAKRVGLPEKEIDRVKWDKRTVAMIRDRLQARMVHGLAETLDSQVERAKESTVAWKALAQGAQVLDNGGVKVNVNTMIDRRNIGDTASDRKFFDKFWDKSTSRIVEDAQVIDESPAH